MRTSAIPRIHGSKRLAVVIVLALVTVAIGSFGSAKPAQAALPRCNHFTWEYLGGMGPYALYPTAAGGDYQWKCILKYGDNTWGVWALQRALNKCHNAGLVEDGVYGPATKAAVTWMQAANGITADGIYGPQTATYAIRFPVYYYRNLDWPANYCTGVVP